MSWFFSDSESFVTMIMHLPVNSLWACWLSIPISAVCQCCCLLLHHLNCHLAGVCPSLLLMHFLLKMFALEVRTEMYYNTTNFLIAHAALPICYLNYIFRVKSCLLLDIMGLPLPSQKAEGRWDLCTFWFTDSLRTELLSYSIYNTLNCTSVEREYYYKHQNW
jgi:hypothetical protein